MLNEWDLHSQITRLLNGEHYEELEKLVLDNSDNLTPAHLHALTELPVNDDVLAEKHKKLYDLYIEKGEEVKDNFGLRSAIRFELIKCTVEGLGEED